MQSSILSVDVLNELVVNLLATYADAAYERLKCLPSHVRDGLTRLFMPAPLRPGYLALQTFRPMQCLRALHIMHPDIGAEDADQTEDGEYYHTCKASLRIVMALVSAGQAAS